MGTLFEQDPRNNHRVVFKAVDYLLEDAAKMAEKHKTTIETVIAAMRVLELERQNDLTVSNGDIEDEKHAGFGEILVRIANSLEKISEKD